MAPSPTPKAPPAPTSSSPAKSGGSLASRVFLGLGLGGLYTLFQNSNLFAAWPDLPKKQPDFGPQHILKGASFKADATPEYLGVGYIIGPRVAGIIFAGGVFSWLVLMPLIYFFGDGTALTPSIPGPSLSPTWVPASSGPRYIRPMGAGAVAAAGLITLLKTLPTIVSALTSGFSNMQQIRWPRAQAHPHRRRPLHVRRHRRLHRPRRHHVSLPPVQARARRLRRTRLANLAASLLVVVFGFLFVTVSSRIVGLIGSSASPVSGMTIATLMATSAIFLVKGWTAPAYGALAITIGGAVCIAASNSGDTSQDLKTGYLIGATPRLQQVALMIGVCVSTLIIGVVLTAMNNGFQEFRAAPQAWDINSVQQGVSVQRNANLPERINVTSSTASSGTDKSTTTHSPSEYIVLNALGSPVLADGKYLYSPASRQIEVQWIQGIGSERAAAPQARLMATVINGILSQKLPWGLVLMGVFLVVAVELLGIRSLSFAVGAYLSIGTTLAIFVGGVMRLLVDMALKKAGRHADDSEISPGALYASGLIAAGGIVGLLGVAKAAYENLSGNHIPIQFPEIPYLHSNGTAIVMFGALAFSLYYFARKPLKES